MEPKTKILLIFVIAFCLGGPIAVYNLLYGTVWLTGLTMWTAVKLFPGQIVWYIGVPILMAIIAFIASFYRTHRPA
jgi:hypothetical protein